MRELGGNLIAIGVTFALVFFPFFFDPVGKWFYILVASSLFISGYYFYRKGKSR